MLLEVLRQSLKVSQVLISVVFLAWACLTFTYSCLGNGQWLMISWNLCLQSSQGFDEIMAMLNGQYDKLKLLERRRKVVLNPQFHFEFIWGPFLTSPLGANFTPRGDFVPQGWKCPLGPGWSYPLGVKFSVRPSILLNSRECSPWGWTKGWISPRGDTFHPWGPGVKLRMALRPLWWVPNPSWGAVRTQEGSDDFNTFSTVDIRQLVIRP
jgi:hypothetical protein